MKFQLTMLFFSANMKLQLLVYEYETEDNGLIGRVVVTTTDAHEDVWINGLMIK
jgi:predicted neutral ceramidase superfamily lipid hydrolase